MVKVIESNFNNAVAETDPGYGQIFSILWHRRFWLLSVFAGVLTIATVLTLRAKPTYESSMQLQIEPNYQGKEGQRGVDQETTDFADSNVEIDYASQLNVMRSPLLLRRAVNLLKTEYPDIDVKKLQKFLALNQIEEGKVTTKIVRAVYTDNDPVRTQKVLEAVQKVYQVYNRQQQEQRLAKGLSFINEQLPQVKEQVRRAESDLEKFRKGQNLIDPQQRATAIAEALNSIEKERQATRAQYQEAQARYRDLQQQLARSPKQALNSSRLSQSVRYQALLNELQKTELALEQQRLIFTDAAPSVTKLIEQRDRQLALLQEEVTRVLGTESVQLAAQGKKLRSEGQLGEIDLNLTSQLVEVEVNTRALVARDQSLAKTEQELRTQLNRYPALLAEYNRLQPEVEIERDTLQQLLKARQELGLEIARGGFDWQVLEEPALGLKTGPDLKQNLLLGAVAGLMLGGVAAFLREMVDDAVHTSAELEKQAALPLLGATPELPPTKKLEPTISLPFGQPQVFAPWTVRVVNWPPCWEALDLIFKNIQLLNTASEFKSLMVTSALPGEGKSTLALGLAISAARLHQRVLLVDADLRCPSLHQRLSLPNEQGLSTLLSNDVTLPSRSRVELAGSHFDVLTAGPTPTDPANLLSSHRMQELMTAFEETYDLVLLDAPPVLGLVDAIIAGSFCSGVVLAARIGQVTRTELAEATTMLSKLNVIGVVANGVSGPTKGYYLPYGKQQRSLSLRS